MILVKKIMLNKKEREKNMIMTTLKKKLNKKGFTLAELLIVVAIIAILVAVSIPIFTSKLNDAREATDQANGRAAKAAAVTEYLNEEMGAGTYYYDAENGVLKDDKTQIAPYGKSAETVDGATGTPKDNILEVTIADDGVVTLEWVPNN